MGDNRLQPLVLSDVERLTLQGWAGRRSTAQGLAMRVRIVLDGVPWRCSRDLGVTPGHEAAIAQLSE